MAHLFLEPCEGSVPIKVSTKVVLLESVEGFFKLVLPMGVGLPVGRPPCRCLLLDLSSDMELAEVKIPSDLFLPGNFRNFVGGFIGRLWIRLRQQLPLLQGAVFCGRRVSSS